MSAERFRSFPRSPSIATSCMFSRFATIVGLTRGKLAFAFRKRAAPCIVPWATRTTAAASICRSGRGFFRATRYCETRKPSGLDTEEGARVGLEIERRQSRLSDRLLYLLGHRLITCGCAFARRPCPKPAASQMRGDAASSNAHGDVAVFTLPRATGGPDWWRLEDEEFDSATMFKFGRSYKVTGRLLRFPLRPLRPATGTAADAGARRNSAPTMELSHGLPHYICGRQSGIGFGSARGTGRGLVPQSFVQLR
jgi:hypothetical protein